MTASFHIFGVPFHGLSQEQVLQELSQAFQKESPLFLVTPNPEICLEAQKNPDFLKVLRQSSLSIPDGAGILWADDFLQGPTNIWRWFFSLMKTPFRKQSPHFPERVTGTDVVQQFFKQFPERRVFLLGASEESNQRLFEKLRQQGVQVVGRDSGSSSEDDEERILKKIQDSEAEVLFVAFGAPKQEFWIARNLKKIPRVRVAAGIGGAFDFLAGSAQRAPLWMRNMGLEWLFRLIHQPKRIPRIFRATVVFPWRVFRWARKNPQSSVE